MLHSLALLIALCPTPYTRVAGRVIDIDAQPVANAEIQARAADGTTVVVRSDDNGNYRLYVAGELRTLGLKVRRIGLQPAEFRVARGDDGRLTGNVQLLPIASAVVARGE